MKTINIIGGFFLLFAWYHMAEYLMLFRNSPAGFLLFSALFFPLAFLIAKWQGDKTLKAWGLAFKKTLMVYLVTGLLAGLVISTLMFLTCLLFNIEVIRFVPPIGSFLPQAAMLVFGCAVSSLTEDVLTRGYLYRHLKTRWSKPAIVLFSALIYALNHLYRLNEPVYFLYAFILGIQLIVPLIATGNIWYTLGIHWAGNIVYHLTNNVMHTTNGSNPFSGIVVAIIFAALSIPVHVLIIRQVSGTKEGSLFALQRHSSAFIRHSSGIF